MYTFIKLKTFLAALTATITLHAHTNETQTNLNTSESYRIAPADGHAPIGVMGDHVHKKGEWMLAYRYMYMDMGQNYIGDHKVSPAEVLAQGYLVTPTDMTMEMHMFGMMYGLTDQATFMLGVPYVIKDMNHQIGGPPPFPLRGQTFNTHTSGLGDVKLTLLYEFYKQNGHHIIADGGFSLPTGSINETGYIPLPPPAGSSPVLPYPMQLGSGSFGWMPRLTYVGHTNWLSWGAQMTGTIWLNDNSADYRLGDNFNGTTWIAKPWADWISTSFRLSYNLWGNIRGADSRIAQASPMPGLASVPTAQPGLRGGQRVNALLGINVSLPVPDSWPIDTNRLAIEGGIPAWQRLDGPQLGIDWQVTAGWQMSW